MRHFILRSSLLLWTGVAGAQTHRGAGISGATVANGVSADYVRFHWGPPDSVRLGAAVLWRGTTAWALSRNGAEADWARAAMDSARKDAERRGAQAAGTITASANAWVEFDQRTARVTVLRRSYPLVAKDSALVLLVDHVDHVGGDPTVRSITVNCPKIAVATNGQSDQRQAMLEGMRLMNQSWRACLLSDPRVADFVNRTSSRKSLE